LALARFGSLAQVRGESSPLSFAAPRKVNLRLERPFQGYEFETAGVADGSKGSVRRPRELTFSLCTLVAS